MNRTLMRNSSPLGIRGLPASNRDELFRPFEQVLDSIINELEGFGWGNLKNQGGYPRCDVLSHNNQFVIELAVPGTNPADIKVAIEPGGSNSKGEFPDILHVSGNMENQRTGAHYHVRELSRRAWKRSLTLPSNIKGDPEVKFSRGILTLAWELQDESPPSPLRFIPVVNTDD